MRLLTALLLALLLAGCSAEPEPVLMDPETIPQSTAKQETQADTQPEETETLPMEPITYVEPRDEDFVRVSDYLPNIQQELPYATADNFTGQRIYEFTQVYLRCGTVKKLCAVWEELDALGYSIKIWDGFRPVSAQFKLWEVFPNPTYVANPTRGHSSHSRGNTIDLTIIDKNGQEIEMPTGFDDFSAKANRDYSDCSDTEAANAQLLQDLMEKHGFKGYFGEWWHYADTVSYPVEESFTPLEVSVWYADCEEFISLRSLPDTVAEVITRIPTGGQFQILAEHGEFYYVDYQSLAGYVLKEYCAPDQK